MGINVQPGLKRFDFVIKDLEFIQQQVRFQPLSATGHAITPPLDANGNPLPGSVTYGPGGEVTVTVTLPDGTPGQYQYASVLDPSGIRTVDGSFNNLLPGQNQYGHTGTSFIRTTDAGFGSYLGQHVPAAGETDSAAHPFASALDPTLHTFGAIPVSAQPDYAIAQDVNTGAPIVHNVIDYTPRMISQTVTSDAALSSTGIATKLDSYNSAPYIGKLATEPGAASYSGWFVLFGQFFDHGLDFIGKRGNVDVDTNKSSDVIIPLAASDPLYNIAPGHQITLGRATVQGFDASGAPVYENHTSPLIDQNQTYGSISKVTDLLREWVEDPNHPGTYIPGMRLLDGHSLQTDWQRWDGVSTDQTLPTLSELRIEVHNTLNPTLDRTDLTSNDIFDYHGTGQPLLIDFLPVADGIDTTSDLNIFGDAPNLLKGIDLNTLLILQKENPGDPSSRTLVLGIKPGPIRRSPTKPCCRRLASITSPATGA